MRAYIFGKLLLAALLMLFVTVTYIVNKEAELDLAWARAGENYLIRNFDLHPYATEGQSLSPRDCGCRPGTERALIYRTEQGPIILCAVGTPLKPRFEHVPIGKSSSINQ